MKDLGFVKEAALLVAMALAAAFVSNAFAGPERRLAWLGRPPSAPAGRPAPGASAAPGESSSVGDFAPHPNRPWVEITAAQAKTLFDRGTLFFDARRSSAYREAHIRGARSISVWESDADQKVKSFLDEGRDPNSPIVVYCSGGDCEDSHELAQKLWGVTFDNMYVYKDGFPDWQKRGWPVETGTAK
jgi:rhodanese-related sulfurtransferase